MKAIVFDCLRDLVLSAFGEVMWQDITQGSPLGGDAPANLADDHPDEQVLGLFAAPANALAWTLGRPARRSARTGSARICLPAIPTSMRASQARANSSASSMRSMPPFPNVCPAQSRRAIATNGRTTTHC